MEEAVELENQYSHFVIKEGDVIRPQTEVDPDQWRLLRRLRVPDRRRPVMCAGRRSGSGMPMYICGRMWTSRLMQASFLGG